MFPRTQACPEMPRVPRVEKGSGLSVLVHEPSFPSLQILWFSRQFSSAAAWSTDTNYHLQTCTISKGYGHGRPIDKGTDLFDILRKAREGKEEKDTTGPVDSSHGRSWTPDKQDIHSDTSLQVAKPLFWKQILLKGEKLQILSTVHADLLFSVPLGHFSVDLSLVHNISSTATAERLLFLGTVHCRKTGKLGTA